MEMEIGRNTGDRVRKSSTLERGVVKSDLSQIAEDLHKEAFEKGAEAIGSNPRTYILQRTVTPSALESLGTLNFENMIYDFEGDLHFATGQRIATVPNYSEYDKKYRDDAVGKTVEQSEEARFTIHNHPVGAPGMFMVSTGDHYSSMGSDSEIDFIVTRDGVIGHKPSEDTAFLKYDNDKNKKLSAFFERGATVISIAYQNPNRTMRVQKEAGVSRFFIPFRGDEDAKRKLELICSYINDPTMRWDSIRKEVEKNSSNIVHDGLKLALFSQNGSNIVPNTQSV